MLNEILDNINNKIKTRTKEQWVQFVKDKFAEIRSYVQDNGEISFVCAFVLGVFVVVFFKLAFALFFISALVFAMVWSLAISEIEQRMETKKDDKH